MYRTSHSLATVLIALGSALDFFLLLAWLSKKRGLAKSRILYESLKASLVDFACR